MNDYAEELHKIMDASFMKKEYIKVPRFLFQELTPQLSDILMSIIRISMSSVKNLKKTDGYVPFSNRFMREHLSLSDEMQRRFLKQLKELGFISVEMLSLTESPTRNKVRFIKIKPETYHILKTLFTQNTKNSKQKNYKNSGKSKQNTNKNTSKQNITLRQKNAVIQGAQYHPTDCRGTLTTQSRGEPLDEVTPCRKSLLGGEIVANTKNTNSNGCRILLNTSNIKNTNNLNKISFASRTQSLGGKTPPADILLKKLFSIWERNGQPRHKFDNSTKIFQRTSLYLKNLMNEHPIVKNKNNSPSKKFKEFCFNLDSDIFQDEDFYVLDFQTEDKFMTICKIVRECAKRLTARGIRKDLPDIFYEVSMFDHKVHSLFLQIFEEYHSHSAFATPQEEDDTQEYEEILQDIYACFPKDRRIKQVQLIQNLKGIQEDYSVSTTQIQLLLQWYLKNRSEKYVPFASTFSAFCAKYDNISCAKKRNSKVSFIGNQKGVTFDDEYYLPPEEGKKSKVFIIDNISRE